MTEANRIPFLDLGGINARFQSEIESAIAEVLASNRYLLGDSNARFAQEFAAWTGASFCVPLANGLDALRLTLKAWMTLGRVVPGDEVIVPANSFIASALAVSDSNLTLRFADVDAETLCVSRDSVSECITDRTRVVMPVHLYGRVSDMVSLRSLCSDAGLLMLEDAAQAHGARLDGASAGTFGDAGAFSFYPSKNLGALGDAGCVITNDAELAERVRMIGNYGSLRKYEHEELGVNSRMDEIQAAILRLKLGHLDADNELRRRIARIYRTQIAHPEVILPSDPADSASHVWHLYVVRVRERNSLAAHLRAQGIETMVHYPTAIHRQQPYRAAFASTHLPFAERLQDEVLSLPMSPVMTESQAQRVAYAVNSWPRRS